MDKLNLKPLRPHQEQAMRLLRRSLGTGHKRPMVQAPTGMGKTVLAAHIVAGALSKGNRVIFVVPALSLIDQTVQSFHDDGIRDVGVIQGNHEMTDTRQPVQVASIQTLMKRNIPPASVVVVDEAHRWFKFQGEWMAQWDAVPFIGLSATPWNKGLGKFYDDLIIAATTADLIRDGYLSPFRVFAPSKPDLKGVRTVAGDYHEGDLSKVMNQPPLVADLVRTWLDIGQNLPTLAFAVDRAHAKSIQQDFLSAGVNCGYIDAYTDRAERNALAKQFNAGELRVIANVGCLTTGIDWDVRCIVLARPTKSEMLFCLDSETEILTRRGWLGMGEIKNGDAAAALDTATGSGVWSRVVGHVERDMQASESWIEYDAPRSNFRVTDRHRMYARKQRSEEYTFVEAGELPEWTGGSVFMRTAVSIDQPGVPLSDSELYFIGMMMADGTWTATGGSISQSERHPEIIERIERCLAGCGIGYSKRMVKPDGNMPERFPRWVFSFSAGKPKPHKNAGKSMCGNIYSGGRIVVDGVTGFRHLMPYLDKDFAPALMGLSKTQFAIFISGIFDGDGFKKKSVTDYLPQTKDICTSRKLAADRIQALCAINGINCSVAEEDGESRKKPIYIIRLKEQIERSHGGYSSKNKPRPKINKMSASNEKVWCIQTEHGTIVTRRRGKVTVMGNCQIIGRCLRTAPGKNDALILDHSDTHQRLGFVTDIHHETLCDGKPKQSKNAEKEIPLPKECPSCKFLKPPKVHVCPSCGFAPQKRSDVEVVDGKLAELIKRRTNREMTPAEKRRFYGELKFIARSHAYSSGWVSHKYRERTGVWPNSYKDSPIAEPSQETLDWVKAGQIRYAKRKTA